MDWPNQLKFSKSAKNLLLIVGSLTIFALIPLTVNLSLQSKPILQKSSAATSSPCQFQKADPGFNVAFCDTFDQPMGTGNRSGDLNGDVWGVSRISADNNTGQGRADVWAATTIQGCGSGSVLPNKDVAICNGKVFEAVNDNSAYPNDPTANSEGGQTVLAMYPKQPFDIAGRTGTVTFDVNADSQGIHAAWPTFVYTDLPVPAPNSAISGVVTSAANSFGFSLAETCGAGSDCGSNCTAGSNGASVDDMFVTRNSALYDLPFTRLGCVTQGNVNSLNHFEVRISQSQVQVWATDPGGSSLREIAQADNANLPLTRGLIWMEDVHYNACKFNSQCNHTFAWDNVGFDGPILARDLATDVPNNTETLADGVNLGWFTPTTVKVTNITNIAQAAKAILTFNWWPFQNEEVPSVQVNGNTWHATAWPFTAGNFPVPPSFDLAGTYVQRTIAVPIPLTELVTGTNTINFKSVGDVVVSNVDIILVGAGGIPTCINPSNCSGSPTPPPPPPVNPPPPPTSGGVIGDLNNDGHVNGSDLAVLLSKWGSSDAAADLNKSGKVDSADLAILLSHWG